MSFLGSRLQVQHLFGVALPRAPPPRSRPPSLPHALPPRAVRGGPTATPRQHTLYAPYQLHVTAEECKTSARVRLGRVARATVPLYSTQYVSTTGARSRVLASGVCTLYCDAPGSDTYVSHHVWAAIMPPRVRCFAAPPRGAVCAPPYTGTRGIMVVLRVRRRAVRKTSTRRVHSTGDLRAKYATGIGRLRWCSSI